MSVWKRLQRVGKRASKFQFTASYQELTVDVTKKWLVSTFSTAIKFYFTKIYVLELIWQMIQCTYLYVTYRTNYNSRKGKAVIYRINMLLDLRYHLVAWGQLSFVNIIYIHCVHEVVKCSDRAQGIVYYGYWLGTVVKYCTRNSL